MKRDAIDFEKDRVSTLFRKLLVPTLSGTISMSAVTAIDGFPYFAAGIVFFILNVAIVGYYQSVEQIKRATAFVFLRGFVLLVPSFIFLPKLLGTEGVRLAMPAAESITTIIIVLMWIRSRKDTAPV